MDERIRDGFLKIRSELLVIVLGLCAVSLVAKNLLFQGELKDCAMEYLILVGSPVYMAVRSHMLEVTQAAAFSKRSSVLGVVAGSLAALLIFCMIGESRGRHGDWKGLVVYGLTFIGSFLFFRQRYKRHEQKRQRKLDSWYDEN